MTLQTPEQIEQDVRVIRDHFIPVSRHDLVESLSSHWRDHPNAETQRRAFLDIADHIGQRLERHFRDQLKQLAEDYMPFDPDCILVDLQGEHEHSHEERRTAFFQSLEYTLERANFRRLGREEIQQAMTAAKALGIRLVVDFEAFAHLSVWVRGEHIDRWTVRHWYRFFRRETIEVPVHRRLVLVFQDAGPECRPEADPHAVFLKIFKNIPVSDVDTLLPSSRIRLTWMDRGKILFPTLSGIGLSVAKIAKVGIMAMFGGIYGLIAFVMVIATGVGYSLKSFFGYLHTKDKYQLNLTRHLYYQNLGNNVGVLFRLIHEAENQEFREALLAYWVLITQPESRPMTKREIDQAAENWIQQTLGVSVDFEDDDALNKLERFGLARRIEPDVWEALSPAPDQSSSRVPESSPVPAPDSAH